MEKVVIGNPVTVLESGGWAGLQSRTLSLFVKVTVKAVQLVGAV